MGLQETAQGICCNMLICCPWLQSSLLKNHRGVCRALAQSRAEGSSACAAMGSALGPTGKALGSRDRGGDRGAHCILAVAWQGKCLDRGTERSCSCCGTEGVSALPEGDSGGSGKGSKKKLTPLFVPCTPPTVPSSYSAPCCAQPIPRFPMGSRTFPYRFIQAVIPQDATSTGSGAHRLGDSSVLRDDADLCPVQTV